MLTQLVILLNELFGAVCRVTLAPIGMLPDWISMTVIAGLTGIVMLVAYKHTSDQKAIKATRDQIKANLLALSLFKDELRVVLKSQRLVLLGAARLLTLSFVPMLIMLMPMCLFLGQLSLWYQARPLALGEDSVVTVQLAADILQSHEIRLASSPFASVVAGPVVVPSKRMACWRIHPEMPGRHLLMFEVCGQQFSKELVIGDGYTPISLQRPPWNWNAALRHPHERPFPADSAIQLIEVDYPERTSWIGGTRTWLASWLVVSMAAALLARPVFKIHV